MLDPKLLKRRPITIKNLKNSQGIFVLSLALILSKKTNYKIVKSKKKIFT